MRRPVVVVGGGPCGLAAAWELTAGGRECVVLEREGTVGGLCATTAHRGWRFDLGGHRFLTSDRALQDRVVALMGPDLLESERRSAVLHGGRRFAYPLEARDLVRNLGWRTNAAALVGYLREAVRRRAGGPGADESFEGWTVARFGRPLYDIFFGPYTEKLWGLPPSQLSSDWASQRISLLNLGDVALRLLRLRASETRTYARRYLYPRLGIGQLFERIAAVVSGSGVGQVELGASVIGFETARGRITAVRYQQRGREVRLPAESVVCTAPLADTARWLPPAESTAVAAARLRYRAVRFLNLLLDRPDVGESTWLYVADPGTPIARIQEPRRRSPEMAPPGKTSLMLEIPCDPGDGIWTAPDASLAERLLGDLDRLGLPVAPHVRGCFSTRVTHGYPIYHLGYRADRDAVIGAASRFANLHLAGRQGLHRYLFMDVAMGMGFEAGRQVLAREHAPRRIAALERQGELLETAALTAA